MTMSLKAEHLKRYMDIARLLIKHGRPDIVREAGVELPAEEQSRESGAAAKADELADDLERLGPTFVKLGQLLSTRADLFPQPYLDALSRLQDDVEPFSFDEVERIISDEIGAKPSKLFSEIDPKPRAAASLGQVHRAVLRDGREVALKIQRPNIENTV